MSKVSKDKVNTSARQLTDMATCSNRYLLLTWCPGGRVIVDGYMCPHCGADPSIGDCDGVEGYINPRKENV